jgi:hypothetical protein
VNRQCARWNAAVEARIAQDAEIRTVILAARHAVYLEGPTYLLGPAERNRHYAIGFVDGPAGLDHSGIADAYFDRLETLVANLTASGKQVVLVLPVPEVGYDVPLVLAMRARAGEDPAGFSIPRSAYDGRQAVIRARLAAIASRHRASLVDPLEALCDDARCRVFADGHALYFDDDHLSRAGAALLKPQLTRSLRLDAGADDD